MKRLSQMVRVSKEVMEVARHINEATGTPIAALVDQACREAFGWYLRGSQGALSEIGKENGK